MRGVAHNGQVQLPGEILHERRHGGDGGLAPSTWVFLWSAFYFRQGGSLVAPFFRHPGSRIGPTFFSPAPAPPPTLDPRDPVQGGLFHAIFLN